MKSISSKIVYFCIIIFPIFFIAIPRTTTALATTLSLLCIFVLFYNNNFIKIFNSLEVKLVSLAFAAYTIAIIFTQIKFNKFSLHDFQQQGRMLLLLPLFYFIYINKIKLSTTANYSISIAAIAGAFFSVFIFPATESQWGSRHTIQHIDPLNFGYLMLFLAFGNLVIALRWSSNRWHQLICAIAFLCGTFMSIKSGSKTG
ncbi:MAG: hypothetical protein RLY95_1583, partial [Pseudomonadota bacterium]